MRHIVEHYDVSARRNGVSDHIHILDLDLYLADEGSVLLRHTDRLLDAACRADVIILKEYSVR